MLKFFVLDSIEAYEKFKLSQADSPSRLDPDYTFDSEVFEAIDFHFLSDMQKRSWIVIQTIDLNGYDRISGWANFSASDDKLPAIIMEISLNEKYNLRDIFSTYLQWLYKDFLFSGTTS